MRYLRLPSGEELPVPGQGTWRIYAALDIRLSERDLAELDAAFPPPSQAEPLEIL